MCGQRDASSPVGAGVDVDELAGAAPPPPGPPLAATGDGRPPEPAPAGAALGGDEALPWPRSGGQRVVFLLDAAGRFERQLLEDWIRRTRPPEVDPAQVELVRLPASRRGRRRRRPDPRLEAALAAGGDPLLAPLRVVWRAPQRDGHRSAGFRDLLLGDPRDPGPLRQRWVRWRHPERCRRVAAEPATASALRERWRETGWADGEDTVGLAEFVTRQAHLALERAERRLRGARYKVPRLIHEEILERPAFRGELARLAREQGLSEPRARREAQRCLKEIAATHSPLVIDLVAHMIRLLYSQGYGETLQYDREQLQGLFRLAQRHPVVFLPSHKSNLDHLVLQAALHENGLPPNHTAGGINMNFFPVGPLVRRSGVFFIRRSFKDDPIYKHVLRCYIDYLVEKRFSLEWYLEGGRSRSGKLLPPRFGLLAYVVDAFRRGKSEDVVLVPVSIAYDQIQDVGAYADEQRGGAKPRESLGWFVGVVRRMRSRYGDIHLRFGEPLSLRQQLGPPRPDAPPAPDERSVALQKLAFEVSVRINRVTPITPVAFVTVALLGTGERALTVSEVRLALSNLLAFVRERKLPTTVDLGLLESDEGVRSVLDALVENDVVTRYAVGPEDVYAIGPDQQLAASYYRNSIVHFLVNAAIVELALLRAGEEDVADAAAAFWEEAMALRDLLKFEFFFADKERFREELREELALQDAEWERRLAAGPRGARELARVFRPHSAHRALRPFLEAYLVVAECLRRWPTADPVESSELLRRCLDLGRQYHLRGRCRSAASVSKALFQTGERLAAHRGLLEPSGAGRAGERQAFRDEVASALRRVDVVDALAAERRAGFGG